MWPETKSAGDLPDFRNDVVWRQKVPLGGGAFAALSALALGEGRSKRLILGRLEAGSGAPGTYAADGPFACRPVATGVQGAMAKLHNALDGSAEQPGMAQLVLQYSYLQVLDFLTTVAFLLRGAQEGNPVVRAAMTISGSPILGLAAIKVLALLLGIYCWRLGKRKALARVNLAFALLVAWNLLALIVASTAT